MRILIIGNSAAGTAAIETIRAFDSKSSITQLSSEKHSLYSRCLISYYIAGEIGKDSLRYRNPDFHDRMNVDLHTGSHVSEVDPSGQTVRCSDGRTYPFDKLLIGTGSSALIPDTIPGSLRGVFVLRTMDDAESIKQRMSRVRNAVILGGGLVGMRAAGALSRCGIKVHVIVGSNRILSRMIDYDAAQVIGKKVGEHNIELMTETGISEVMHKDGEIVGVKTSHGQVLGCELLIVAKSVKANTDLVRNTDIRTGRGIRTNAFMQTNHENIYSAGDVAETLDIATGDYAINALWTCAVQQGRVAGKNIVGKPAQYSGSIGMNSLNFWGIPLISFGLATPKEEASYTILKESRPERNIYRKIVIGNNRIKGLVLVGETANAGVLFSLIQNRIDVSSFMDELLEDRFGFGKVVQHGGPKVLEQYYGGQSL